MCGSTGAESQLQGQQAQFSQTLQNSYKQLFGQQQDVLQNLDNVYTPIVQAGPSQTGFSPQETAALNTTALDTTGANYANAAKALNGQLAGRGGDSGLESGVDAQLKGNLASQAAGTLSNQELGIVQNNYKQGNENYNNAAAGLQALGTQYSPNSAATTGVSSNQGAFEDASEIAQQNAQAEQAVGGLFGAGLNALSGGFGNLDSTGSSTGFEQAQNFFEGL